MSEAAASGIPRRRFLGYVLAAPTLVSAVRLGFDAFTDTAFADVPSLGASDLYDLTDMLTDAAHPTANLITITMTPTGEAVFALPRAEVGQGITTAFSMIIADEMDLPVEKVEVSLSDARPELVWNQITGGSNSVHSLYTPVRVAAAIARNRLLDAAAIVLGDTVARLKSYQGLITAPSGGSVSFGDLASTAASSTTTPVAVALKPTANLSIVSTPRGRVDALDIVTGRKQFAMDLDIPGALPTMVCRPPTINGTVVRILNQADVEAMPGITDVAAIPTGVAVRGATFGQCIDAVRALQVQWGAGTVDGKSDTGLRHALEGAEQPMPSASLPALATTIDQRFTFSFASNSPLETNCAVADVRADRAEIWSSLKTPIIAKQRIAAALGLSEDQVICHVVQGGGSFGRHLFSDAATEAALASQAFGKPVKLMWHRTDDFRQGRMHPMCTSRVRASYLGANVLAYEQRHTSVSTDFRHGLGEVITATMAEAPTGNTGFAATVFELTQNVPYNFGAVDQLISEIEPGFNTGSMRNIYSPNVTTARELVVDQLAKAMKKDAYQFRRQFLREDRMLAVLDRVAQAGQWGRSMAPGTAQGLALHNEYKSRAAVLVEIDCRSETIDRVVADGYTGPRVTKAVIAVDVGLPINPQGLEAQMLGGLMDGIGLALTFSLHIRDGHALEGSWDDTFYTRQWNVPFEVDVIVMPAAGEIPGGAGELAVAPSFAAVACAYARATGTVPTTFPINHNRSDLGFEVLPTVPPIPESPVDGLAHTF